MKKLILYSELPDLVTVPEAACFLGVARRVVYQLLEYGVLRAIRRQGRVLIDPCCLYQFRNTDQMA